MLRKHFLNRPKSDMLTGRSTTTESRTANSGIAVHRAIQFWAPAQAQPGRASPSPGPAGPRSGQDLPGRDFPDLRFFAEVGNCPRRGRGGRESAPGGRESTVWGAGRANPSWAGIFPTSANSQRSGESLPSLNLPDPSDGPSQPGLWKPDQSWGIV